MQYTISSRGRPIGVTDLGFVRIGGPLRSGWFHPNEAGERLMPRIAAVLPAMRAYVRSDRARGEDGEPLDPESHDEPTLAADVAEAVHHVESLDLTLHREDGSLVPTEVIGIQDTEQLLALAALDDEQQPWDVNELLLDDDEEDELLDEALERSVAHDVRLFELVAADADAMFGDDAEDEDDPLDPIRAWTPAEDRAPSSSRPRYQIHIVLADPADIP